MYGTSTQCWLEPMETIIIIWNLCRVYNEQRISCYSIVERTGQLVQKLQKGSIVENTII